MLPEITTECPYCGEPIELIIDDSLDHQTYVEDCSVCCRPINVEVYIDDETGIRLFCSTDNEA